MLSNCGAGEDSWDPLESKPVILKRHQPWILLGRTDAEAEAPIFWPPDANSWLTVKDPDARKDWRQKEKRVTEDEIVGWHHRFNGDELGQTLRNDEGQGGPVCCSPWGHKESDTTGRLNNNKETICCRIFSLPLLWSKWAGPMSHFFGSYCLINRYRLI